MKAWRSYCAFSKLKACMEGLITEINSILENSLNSDGEDDSLIEADGRACEERLESISGVLRAMDYPEFALYVDEMLALLEASRQLDPDSQAATLTDIRELLFMVIVDFPALMEGVLSGQIIQWNEYSGLFNRMRKARQRGLVFSSDTLLTKPGMDFSATFSADKRRFELIMVRHIRYYRDARKQLMQGDDTSRGLEAMHRVFAGLAVVCRDYRLSSLWGMAASLAESLPDSSRSSEDERVRLLCSFSGILDTVRSKGPASLDQNIPENILEKVLDAFSQPLEDTASAQAIRQWFNLDLNMSREQRRKYRDLVVGYSCREAVTRAIRLLGEQIGLLLESINEISGRPAEVPERSAEHQQTLYQIRDTLSVLGLTRLSTLLDEAIGQWPAASEDSPVPSGEILELTVQALYNCELGLQARSEELERTVFMSQREDVETTSITGARLAVVIEAIRNLERVVIAINHYVENAMETERLGDASDLLQTAQVALSTVPETRAAAWCELAGRYVAATLAHPDARALDQGFHDFAHLVINTILYLEQMGIAPAVEMESIRGENDHMATRVEEAITELESTPSPSASLSPVPDSLQLPSLPDRQAAVNDESPEPEEEPLQSDPGQAAGEVAEGVLEAGEEIREIFIAEADEILPRIGEGLSRLEEEADDREALADIRRDFHTLKGSGRMVGAEAISSLALAVEQALNHRITTRIPPSGSFLGLMSEAREKLVSLVTEYREHHPSAEDPESVAEFVERINQADMDSRDDSPETIAVETVSPGGVQDDLQADSVEPDEEASPEAGSGAEDEEGGEPFAGMFVTEARRQLVQIRNMLEGDGSGLTAAAFQIPVHTLHGSCRVSGEQDFAELVRRVENALQDNPYAGLKNGFSTLLDEFCHLCDRLLSGIEAGTPVDLESDEAVAAFLESLDAMDDGRRHPTGDDEAALVLRGFLNEARQAHAGILEEFRLFAQVEHRGPVVAERLKNHYGQLEGAAGIADQSELASLCHVLTRLCDGIIHARLVADEALMEEAAGCQSLLDGIMQALDADESLPEADYAAAVARLEECILEHERSVENAAVQEHEQAVEFELLSVFHDEATELLQELDTALADWQQAPDDITLMDDIARHLHTLKGSAALVGQNGMSETAHAFETCLLEGRRDSSRLDDAFFRQAEVFLNRLQELFAGFQGMQPGATTEESGAATEETAGVREKPAPGQVGDPVVVTPQAHSPEESPGDESVPARLEQEPERPASVVSIQEARQRTGSGSTGITIDEHVRVSGNLLKRLQNDADEVGVSRNRLEQALSECRQMMGDMHETLGKLQGYLQRFEGQARPGRQAFTGRPANGDTPARADEDFDSLELDRYTELQQLWLSLSEDYDDLHEIRGNLLNRMRSMETILTDQQRTTHKLQDGLISSQMVPFSSIVPRLRRLVRQVSGDLGKSVSVRFSNPDGKIDRSMLQTVIGPLEHMIRNAIDHGIESREERAAREKPEQSELLIRLYRQGANILLEISDDGRGIDPQKIRQKAIREGLISEHDSLSDQAIRQLIFRAGFSTSDQVSRISGRGVGLDVVQEEINQIGGDLELFSTLGQGTTFRIRLPMTSSLNRALLFRLKGRDYVMLLNTIEGILLEKTGDLMSRYADEDAPGFEYAGKTYELVYLGNMLGDRNRPDSVTELDSTAPLLLVSGQQRRLALHVDSVIGTRELVVKSLGSQFSGVPGISGGVILGDGRVAIVLDPISLVDHGHIPERAAPEPLLEVQADEGSGASSAMTVLVVDDSITVRKVTSAILRRHGMNVLLARNGMEAIEILQNTIPDVLLLDIEMPKMDGFEVAAYIRRQDSRVREIPIIMITSRIGDKHRNRAHEIGVNDYMCKPFQEENLLATIAGYQ